MFQFPGFASAAYGFSGGSSLRRGLPHSEILGSKPARGSPRLFAACHVLHRLLAPRHPPDALAFLGPPQRQPHPCTRRGLRPQRMASLRSTPGRTNSSNNLLYKRPSRPQNGRQSQHTHAILTRRPTDGRRGADASLASARHAHDCTRGLERNLVCPRTGFTSPPYDVQRTRSLQHGLRAAS